MLVVQLSHHAPLLGDIHFGSESQACWHKQQRELGKASIHWVNYHQACLSPRSGFIVPLTQLVKRRVIAILDHVRVIACWNARVWVCTFRHLAACRNGLALVCA